MFADAAFGPCVQKSHFYLGLEVVFALSGWVAMQPVTLESDSG